MTDPTVFEMFTSQFIAGDVETALDEPFSLVLTETTAKKYFSEPADALGQSLQNQQGEEFKVTVPLHSYLDATGKSRISF